MVRNAKQVVPFRTGRTGQRSPTSSLAARDRLSVATRPRWHMQGGMANSNPSTSNAISAIQQGGRYGRALMSRLRGFISPNQASVVAQAGPSSVVPRSSRAAANYNTSNEVVEKGESEPPAKKSTTTIERASTDSQVEPYRGEDSDIDMSPPPDEEPMQSSQGDGDDESGGAAGGRGGGGGGPGGGAGGSGSGILGVINPHTYLKATEHYSSKRFRFTIRNRNWKTGGFTDPAGTIFIGRQLPYYTFMWSKLMWYLDLAEAMKIWSNSRYSKIKQIAFEVTLKSHSQTFVTGQAESTLAGNGNVASIFMFRDFNGKIGFTTFDSNTVSGTDLGTLDSEYHSPLWQKLYGTPIMEGANDISAVDGARNYTHVPTVLMDASIPRTHPARYISGLNSYAGKTGDFQVIAPQPALISYTPKNGLIGIGPSSTPGLQPVDGTSANQATRYAYHTNNQIIGGNVQHINEATGDKNVISTIDNYLRNYNGRWTHTEQLAAGVILDMYLQADVENYSVKPVGGSWPSANIDPLFYGVSPRQLDDGGLITGCSEIEINTFICWMDQEGHPLTVNPNNTADDINAFKLNHNYSFNDTGAFIETGLIRADQYGYRGQQMYLQPNNALPIGFNNRITSK